MVNRSSYVLYFCPLYVAIVLGCKLRHWSRNNSRRAAGLGFKQKLNWGGLMQCWLSLHSVYRAHSRYFCYRGLGACLQEKTWNTSPDTSYRSARSFNWNLWSCKTHGGWLAIPSTLGSVPAAGSEIRKSWLIYKENIKATVEQCQVCH